MSLTGDLAGITFVMSESVDRESLAKEVDHETRRRRRVYDAIDGLREGKPAGGPRGLRQLRYERLYAGEGVPDLAALGELAERLLAAGAAVRSQGYAPDGVGCSPGEPPHVRVAVDLLNLAIGRREAELRAVLADRRLIGSGRFASALAYLQSGACWESVFAGEPLSDAAARRPVWRPAPGPAVAGPPPETVHVLPPGGGDAEGPPVVAPPVPDEIEKDGCPVHVRAYPDGRLEGWVEGENGPVALDANRTELRCLAALIAAFPGGLTVDDMASDQSPVRDIMDPRKCVTDVLRRSSNRALQQVVRTPGVARRGRAGERNLGQYMIIRRSDA
ncbi:hypothetical protein [Gemmata sp.]|uniref:hypothetical protein n=1 Tax=Gemmata sp. TaxID=1914242 RepID=UPI003F6F341B